MVICHVHGGAARALRGTATVGCTHTLQLPALRWGRVAPVTTPADIHET